MELTHSLSHQLGAVLALPGGERGTWESERVVKERKWIHPSDRQIRPSSSDWPDKRNGTDLGTLIHNQML